MNTEHSKYADTYYYVISYEKRVTENVYVEVQAETEEDAEGMILNAMNAHAKPDELAQYGVRPYFTAQGEHELHITNDSGNVLARVTSGADGEEIFSNLL